MPKVSRVTLSGSLSAADAGVERRDGGNLFAGELEVEDVVILGDPGGLG